MRCKSCDCRLSDLECSRKSAATGEYLDICNHCYSYIKEEVPTIVNPTLIKEESIDDDDDSTYEYTEI